MKLIWLHRVILSSLLGFYFINLLHGQTTPAAGDILFTHADANGDVFEFITLKRLNLNSLGLTDNGVCSNDLFRLNEQFHYFPVTGLSDIPCGTLIRVSWNVTGTNDLDPLDGIIAIFTGTGSPGLNATGEQIIGFIGTPNGISCGGTGSISYISGIDWGNTGSGWNSGSTATNNSKAPGTSTDFAETTIISANDNAIWFNGSVSGNLSAIISNLGSGVRNSTNWSGTGTGTGTFLPLKNIQFHSSNYSSGNAIASNGGVTTSTLNLSGISFSNTNTDTRYLVVMHANTSPSTPANRFTCYTPNSNYGSAPAVVTSVTTPPCTGTSTGNGKVVYFNYTLPSSLIVTGLSNNTCYNVQVYAINGNGYSANYSSTPASFNFFTGNLVSSLIAY
jgi:hypothetical protein